MEAGKIPRTVECELTADLVGVCTPGENVSVTGILKVHHGAEDQRNRNNKDKCRCFYVIDPSPSRALDARIVVLVTLPQFSALYWLIDVLYFL